jgi:hypothetical protein
MAFTNPQVADFKNYFVRDFTYSTDINQGITDTDIAVAFTKVNPFINPDFFPDQSTYNNNYLALAAHYMVLSIRRSGQGLNSQASFLLTGKSAGPVSSSFTIPQRLLDNPELANLMKTGYGEEYLMYVLPQLSGMVFVNPAQMTQP